MNTEVKKISIPLAVILLMFPQIIETMYSPALTSIKNHFGVSAAAAAQALSIFFIAFAVGVVVWGRMCDVIGRRTSTLTGLIVFIISATFTLMAPTFDMILTGCAFGAAVASICIQTIIRDGYHGMELSHVFSIVGTSIGLSPVIGMLTGSWLTAHGGYTWVFSAMVIFVAALLVWAFIHLPETKPANNRRDSLLAVGLKMLKDDHIWYISLMVAIFNISLFSYYSIAPFMFEKLGVSVEYFGYTGFLLAAGSIIGSMINMRLIRRHLSHDHIISLATALLLLSGICVYLLQDSVWFFIPMMLVYLSFGLALPNLLSGALTDYRDHLGSAGALLGLFYYLMIGFGLHAASDFGSLAITLLICGLVASILVGLKLTRNVISSDLSQRTRS
ncbi:Putative uncharacterized protein [Moritella viscosa]|uniref:MFS transporter n=1 Tax=Moritella viscosa TaxID=80854 RepID=UPI00091175CF|nr:MFS transporter [Moritella viscosa]SGZ09552.1 Putative uncharacterized protein [Moritella viscosa]